MLLVKPREFKENSTSEMTQSSQPCAAESPWKKAAARSIASFGTWFCTEYPKLIVQQQQQQQHSKSGGGKTGNLLILLNSFHIYKNTPFKNHWRGALSSAGQRGSSAWIMFYGQAFISQTIYHGPDTTSGAIPWWTAGLAGVFGGGISSLVHSLFEPIKIRHEPLSWRVYSASLWPMMWRHALFDGTFFATSSLLETNYSLSHATQFGLSALVASTVNLSHDVWKTQYIKALPKRLQWLTVVRSLSWASFRQQLAVKGADLGFNWWLTGLLYGYLFVSSSHCSSGDRNGE